MATDKAFPKDKKLLLFMNWEASLISQNEIRLSADKSYYRTLEASMWGKGIWEKLAKNAREPIKANRKPI